MSRSEIQPAATTDAAESPKTAAADAPAAAAGPVSRRSVLLYVGGSLAALLLVGYLGAFHSGTITENELKAISRERRLGPEPPSVPEGADDTRQMIRSLKEELGTLTERLTVLQFRSRERWATWTAVAVEERQSPAFPTVTSPGRIGPSDPVAEARERALESIAPLPNSLAHGFAGEPPGGLDPPAIDGGTNPFDLTDVTVLDDLASIDATARREVDLGTAERGWITIERGDDIEVSVRYESAETGDVVATIVVDADGNFVEVRR